MGFTSLFSIRSIRLNEDSSLCLFDKKTGIKNGSPGRGAVAQSVDCPSKIPSQCNSTDMGLNPSHGKRW